MYEKAGKPIGIRNKRRSTVHESDDDMEKQTKPSADAEQQSNSAPTAKRRPESTRPGITLPSSSTTPSTTTRSEGVAVPEMNGTSSTPRPEGFEYKVNDRVNIWYGKGKTQRTYEAKVKK